MNALDRSVAVVSLAVFAAACAPSVQQEVEIGNQYSAEIDRTMPLITESSDANDEWLTADELRAILPSLAVSAS